MSQLTDHRSDVRDKVNCSQNITTKIVQQKDGTHNEAFVSEFLHQFVVDTGNDSRPYSSNLRGVSKPVCRKTRYYYRVTWDIDNVICDAVSVLRQHEMLKNLLRNILISKHSNPRNFSSHLHTTRPYTYLA